MFVSEKSFVYCFCTSRILNGKLERRMAKNKKDGFHQHLPDTVLNKIFSFHCFTEGAQKYV